jgi:hypothetical protein
LAEEEEQENTNLGSTLSSPHQASCCRPPPPSLTLRFHNQRSRWPRRGRGFGALTMSTIQNLKNFIRHGKQARISTPHAEPTTNVSTVHAEPQRQTHHGHGTTAMGGLDSIDASGTRAPKSEQTAQKLATASPGTKLRHEQELEQIIQEEKWSKSNMPKYPGLDRYVLLEKMGDGAFSNVYRARDTTGKVGEVAIKVVRKFEMNSKQVWVLVCYR